MRRRIYFYLTIGVFGLLEQLAQYFMLRAGYPQLAPYWTLLLFLAAPLLFVIPNTLEKHLPLSLERVLAFIGGYWFVGALYLTLASLPFYLLWLLSYASVFPMNLCTLYAQAAPWVVLLILARGCWKALHPTVRRVDMSTEKETGTPVTFAFASDIHLGPLLGPWFARKLVRHMNRLRPDYILLGGDIIDGNLHVVERSGSFAPLAGLKPLKGTYAVLGNHDHYSARAGRQKEILQSLGIHVLSDEAVTLQDHITLLGMGDYAFHHDSPIPDIPPEDFTIFMEHEPARIPEAAKRGADLYLAGHTHAGQFWPVRHWTGKLFPLDYGTAAFGHMTAIVTSGYGCWGPLFRTGPKPEIVLITLRERKA